MIKTYEDALARVEQEVDTASPRAIEREVACRLLRTPDSGLHSLLASARRVRDRFHPQLVSYSRKVCLPLTNL